MGCEQLFQRLLYVQRHCAGRGAGRSAARGSGPGGSGERFDELLTLRVRRSLCEKLPLYGGEQC